MLQLLCSAEIKCPSVQDSFFAGFNFKPIELYILSTAGNNGTALPNYLKFFVLFSFSFPSYGFLHDELDGVLWRLAGLHHGDFISIHGDCGNSDALPSQHR